MPVKFKELEPGLKFETRLKHGWLHLKTYSVFRDVSMEPVLAVQWRALNSKIRPLYGIIMTSVVNQRFGRSRI